MSQLFINAMRLKAYEEAVAYHLHKTINTDLEELLSGSPISTPSLRSVSPSTSMSLNSISSSPSIDPISLPMAIQAIGDRKVCQVQFKHVFRHYRLPVILNEVKVGAFVMVQSFVDKSLEDLGVITRIYSLDEFETLRTYEGPSEDADENKVGRILRVATTEELKYLPMKFQREYPLLRICQTFVSRHLLPMTVYGAEFQYDGQVLFVYYESKERVDFRPLVKFLIKMYCPGTRIQMKKTNQCREFVPVAWASDALITGRQFMPESSGLFTKQQFVMPLSQFVY